MAIAAGDDRLIFTRDLVCLLLAPAADVWVGSERDEIDTLALVEAFGFPSRDRLHFRAEINYGFVYARSAIRTLSYTCN